MQQQECNQNKHLEEGCIVRHAQQDQMIADMKEIKEALIGKPSNQEESLISKVNVLVGDMRARQKWTVTLVSVFAVFVIGLIFSAGVVYNRLNNIESQVTKNTADIAILMRKEVK